MGTDKPRISTVAPLAEKLARLELALARAVEPEREPALGPELVPVEGLVLVPVDRVSAEATDRVAVERKI
jgi:hypothetical protein